MKIGILTFHNAYNYGAILQTYATQEIVRKYGHSVEIIDYHNAAIDRFYDKKKFHFKAMPKRNSKSLLVYLIAKFFNLRRNSAFKVFTKNNLILSKHKYLQGDKMDLSDYDVILIGSDQLWNKSLTGGIDRIYWAQFDTSAGTRKVSWSVCMNNMNVTTDETSLIKNFLKHFSAISVREVTLQAFISQLTDKKVWHTIDPTLLLSSQKWEEVCHPVKESNYIAVYAVRKEEETISFARKLASSLNKKLIIIRSYSKWYFSSENKEYCGPDDFLSYIKYADYVVTSSFHGTVFSLIFQRQFVCPVIDGNIRVEDLLLTAGLSNRFVKDWKEALLLSPIDYNNLSNQLELKRKETIDFLSNVLK